MPEGGTVVGDADATIVQCVEPTVLPDEEEEVAVTGAEPEVIGEKSEAEGGDSE